VKLLALSPNHRLHREQVMDALWPDLGPDAAGANLRKAIHYARRALGSEKSIASGEEVVFWPGGDLVVDADRFEAAARDAIASGDRAAAAAAAAVHTGELLPADRYAEWTLERRDRAGMLLLDVLAVAGDWERVIELDRANEAAHRALIRSHLDAGNRQAAIRQFERLREVLRADMGVGPDEETVALYEQATTQDGRVPPSAAEQAGVLLARGLVHWNRQDLDHAERDAHEARTVAIGAGLGREIGEASALLGMVALARGKWREVFRDEFLMFVKNEPDFAVYVFDGNLCLADYSMYGADGYAQIEPLARELLAFAEESGSVLGQALPALMLGEVALFQGRFEEAEALLSRAVTLHEKASALSGQVLAMQRLAEASIARGRRWQAGRILAKGRRLAETTEMVSHLVVRLWGASLEAIADASRRMSVLREAEEALAARDMCDPCSMGFRLGAAATSARVGDLPRARRYLAEAERIGGMWQGGPWHAATWETRGELRRAEGEPAQAAALFREAADLFGNVGRPVDADRCRSAAAAVAS
jgi:DNA-binding SARP family transcriptional activator